MAWVLERAPLAVSPHGAQHWLDHVGVQVITPQTLRHRELVSQVCTFDNNLLTNSHIDYLNSLSK
jgi:hypothetical protein